MLTVYPDASQYSRDIVSFVKSLTSLPTSITMLHISEYRHIHDQSFVILLSGEPDDLQPHVIANLKILPYRLGHPDVIYYPFLYSSLCERYVFKTIVQPKQKFCAFMYSQNHQHRNDWFHRLHTLRHVDALGDACKNVEVASTRCVYNDKETYNDIAVKLYSDYSFVLAIENTWREGYFTEKLINPIMAHSIPLYWGHPSAFEYVNKNRVLYLPDFATIEDIYTELCRLENSIDAYQEIINQPWYTEKGQPDNVKAYMIEALSRHLSST